MLCRTCQEDKPIDRFSVVINRGKKTGHRSICKDCRGKAYRASPEIQRLRVQKSFMKAQANPIKRSEYNERVRAYRALRKSLGNPIQRNCVSDKYRKHGRFNLFIRADVFNHYGKLCSYCGEPADQIDHVVPLKHGGQDLIENLVPACKSCNSSKQDSMLTAWLLKRKVGYLYRNPLC